MILTILLALLVLDRVEPRLRPIWLRWRQARQASPDAEVVRVVLQACADVGLNRATVTLDTDLVKCDRVLAVLQHAAEALGKDPRLRTVGDVVEWVARAPERSV